ncbi:uncharacterized protein LOC119327702 isoform X1 [Triticum dicoccoides]|uniref:uncharacterized protein LOC119327702 isoform X1 n=2 Tax=Triticum dicoccoides TaxID=85692 RepID=UPI000E7CCDF3|nr:uncharacterized protein LOC119327702 isoform X1 [Triticum dicoccoides]
MSATHSATRCDEHVGHTVQPPSAQAVQELVDSFSDQKLDATKTKSMHGGIEEQAKNDTIFSPKQVGLCRSYREMLTDEEEDVVSYRRFWEYTWGGKCGSFEDYTFVTPILYTYGTIPAHAGPFSFLQIFSIKVMENEMWRIRWPVGVYGFIAARDNLDRNRNLLFSQTRDDPQILTQQDSFLQLTGPCRPVALIDPVVFEIQLKVKGRTECEDETLIARSFEYGYGFGEYGELACRRWAGNFCTLEITSALLSRTVAATIISADVIKGSWPVDYRGRVVARTADIDEDFVLLDSGEGRLQVNPDGRIVLQRGVVCVEHEGMLTVSVEAYSEAGTCRADCVEFKPQKSLTSNGTCNLGFCTVQFIVGWSLMARKYDLMYDGN